MTLKPLRTLFAIGLIAMAGRGWATVSLPSNQDPKWNDISNIAWSTDNGVSWGNSALTVGQTVEFNVTLHKTYDGKHYADFVKVWIDWNGDEQFSSAEAMLFDYHVVNSSYTPNTGPGNLVNQSFNFISAPVTLTSAMLGEHFLLARVTCSESLLTTANVANSWNQQWNSAYTSNNNALYNNLFSPTATYHQGESELVKLTVNENEVPEPGTLALIATAIAAMGLEKRRRAGV